MMNVFVVSLALLGLHDGRTDAEEQEEAYLEAYDLGAILSRVDDESWNETLAVPPAGSIDRADPARMYTRPSGDVILQIVSRTLEDDVFERGRELTLQGEDTLLLLAPRVLHERARAVLDALARTVSATATVRVDVLTLEGGGEAPARVVIDAGEADRLVATATAQGARHRSFQVELGAGRTTVVDGTRGIPFVYDYDIEIAQGAFVYDPVVEETREGLRLLMRASPTAGGLVVACSVLETELVGDVRDRPLQIFGRVGREEGGFLEVQGPDTLQAVDVLVNGFAAETFLPEGKALVFASQHASGEVQRRRLLLLRTERAPAAYATQTIPGTSRQLLILNGELFRRPWLSVGRGTWGEEDWGHVAVRSHPKMIAGLRFEPPHFLIGWIRRFAFWDRIGPWILVYTDRQWDGESAKELSALVAAQADVPRVVDVELTLHTPDGPAPASYRLPVIEGSDVALALGRTSSAIIDLDTEVAHFCSAPDPTVIPTFEGFAFGLEVSRAAGERLLNLFGSAHLARTGTTGPRIEHLMLGQLDLPRQDVLLLDERRALPVTDGANRVTLGAEGAMSVKVTVR